MSNKGSWEYVTFSELQAGDKVQVRIEENLTLGLWERRTVDQGEFVLGSLLQDGWFADGSPVELAVLQNPRSNVIQSIKRWTPPFEFPTTLGAVFSGQHFEEGRHTFIYVDPSNSPYYRPSIGWYSIDDLERNYSDFKMGEA